MSLSVNQAAGGGVLQFAVKKISFAVVGAIVCNFEKVTKQCVAGWAADGGKKTLFFSLQQTRTAQLHAGWLYLFHHHHHTEQSM